LPGKAYRSPGLLTPFHDALVPGITLLGERSFSTRLGNLHEKVAALVAAEVHAEVRQPHDLSGAIPVLLASSSHNESARSRAAKPSRTQATSGSRSLATSATK
jgi:hypothetical protein